jgi:hypothetical protein
VSEFEVWQGLANLYSSLSYWRDADICLQKAKALKTYSAATLHAEGEEFPVTCLMSHAYFHLLFGMYEIYQTVYACVVLFACCYKWISSINI